MRSHVPCVDDGDDLTDIRVIEDETDHLSHGFGAWAGALRTRCHGEADLCLLTVSRETDANIANQFVVVLIRDSKLDPGSASKEPHVAHVLDKPRRLVVGLWLPPLELAHLRVTPIEYEGLERCEGEQPQ